MLLAHAAGAQTPTEITTADANVSPESITSSQDGTVFFGSTTKGTSYRALPGPGQAQAWILAEGTGLTNTLGVLADDKANTLWVCSNATGGRGGAPVTGKTALRAFDLRSGAAKNAYDFPGGGLCNDIAVAADGTAYATDTTGGRILRLKPGASALDVWVADPAIAIVDGIALLADGAVYVNTFTTGRLVRIPVGRDGAAGALVQLEPSQPFVRPDGLRSVGADTLVQAEGQGRVTEIKIAGNRAEVRVLKEGLTGATAVTQSGQQLWVLVQRSKASAVAYTPSK
jgi:sugar lactone lactonase YvrE